MTDPSDVRHHLRLRHAGRHRRNGRPRLAGGRPKDGETSITRHDAWEELRRRPTFWISGALIVLFVAMAAFPQLFTSTDPYCADLAKARETPSADAWFGRDGQGYDVYARTIYGARASIMVGIFSTMFTLLAGSLIGIIAGYQAGWLDSVLSRVGRSSWACRCSSAPSCSSTSSRDSHRTTRDLGAEDLVRAQCARLAADRSTDALQRAAGQAQRLRTGRQSARGLTDAHHRSHILPNSLASVIVVSTINLGVFISVEATLSFLGVGLQPPAISWGIQISEASGIGLIRVAPHMLIFPSIFLSATVLAFIMLGDVVRDAFDPKLR